MKSGSATPHARGCGVSAVRRENFWCGIEGEMEDLEALRAARETKAAIERGEEEAIPWDQAMREIREGKASGN